MVRISVSDDGECVSPVTERLTERATWLSARRGGAARSSWPGRRPDVQLEVSARPGHRRDPDRDARVRCFGDGRDRSGGGWGRDPARLDYLVGRIRKRRNADALSPHRCRYKAGDDMIGTWRSTASALTSTLLRNSLTRGVQQPFTALLGWLYLVAWLSRPLRLDRLLTALGAVVFFSTVLAGVAQERQIVRRLDGEAHGCRATHDDSWRCRSQCFGPPGPVCMATSSPPSIADTERRTKTRPTDSAGVMVPEPPGRKGHARPEEPNPCPMPRTRASTIEPSLVTMRKRLIAAPEACRLGARPQRLGDPQGQLRSPLGRLALTERRFPCPLSCRQQAPGRRPGCQGPERPGHRGDEVPRPAQRAPWRSM